MLVSDYITAILPLKTENIFVAFSGGIDSHVLLHLAALTNDLKPKITAVHVHHGIQTEADAWAEHCQTIALGLGVEFKCLSVEVQKKTRQSLEELARNVRYQAFKSLLGEHDVILLAQHREDQMETVLLQLFRGSGVQGLSGMPLSIPFGKGLMCRPLLDVSKQKIKEYAQENQLTWIEDPSNKSDDFDRNFLRNQVLPQLKQKWPGLDKTIARSARHCASAHNILEELAKELLNQIIDKADNTLNITQLLKLDFYKQQLVLRQWFTINQLRMPSEKKLQNIIKEVIKAKESRNPEIRGQGYCIRRYRNKLFCITTRHIDQEYYEQHWAEVSKKLLLNDGSKLVLFESDTGIPKIAWEKAKVVVKFRQGSEKIRLPGREGRHSLKKLYQEKAIAPWQRANIPLVYLDNNLAAIADLWVSADYCSDNKQACYQIDWLKP